MTDTGRLVPPHGSGGGTLPPIHAAGGLHLAMCGKKLNWNNWEGDPDRVTCPACRAELERQP